CFKIIGYLGKKKPRQNVKGKNISNNNSVGSSSSSGFTDEQMATFISLIKDNKVGKNVHANMPEYCVTLIYVHKLAKDNKIFVVFDESRCYFLNLKNVMGIDANDDERVDPNLNSNYRSQSDSSHSSVSGGDVDTADFPSNNSGNDADSSDDIFAAHDEQGTQTVRMSSRQSVFPRSYNDFVIDSKVKYELEKYVGYSKLNSENYCFVTQLNKNCEPKSFFEASKFSHWTDAMNNEMDDLFRNDTWDIVDLPKDRLAIISKWIFKIKYKSSGEIDRYKARLMLLVLKMVTVRCLLNVDVSNSWHVFQLDVNNAFLYGDMVETVYMKPPEGYFPSDNKVCRLKKSLYGLKQAPRQWNPKLTYALIENSFSQSKSDYSLYTKSDNGVFLASLVYVDDINITGNSICEIDEFKVFLKSKFMKKDLGKLKYFLGKGI
ncbi:ribonuclease H-like domain-containing protein, partial [Tanacetum coccineum]